MYKFLLIVNLIWFVNVNTNYAQQDNSPEQITEVNGAYNSEYKKSIELTSGVIDSLNLKQFYKALEHNIGRTLDTTMPVIIGFMQNGLNCITYSSGIKHLKKTLAGYNKSMQNMTRRYGAKGYIVYTSDAFLSGFPCSECIEDKGFVKDHIFPSDRNCMGFFVLFKEGTFYKYYGEDYFSVLRKILETNT